MENWFPFLLSDIVEGKIVAQDRGYDDFNLQIIDDNFNYSGRNGSDFQNDEDEDSESSIKSHDSYDDKNDGHTYPVTTIPMIVYDGDGNDVSGEQPLVRRTRGSDSTASAALVAVLADGECSSGMVLKRSCSFELGAFHDFVNSLSMSHPTSYVRRLNMNRPPQDVDALYPTGPIYVPAWKYRLEESLIEPKASIYFFENVASPGTHSSVSQGGREHVQDMHMINLVEKSKSLPRDHFLV